MNTVDARLVPDHGDLSIGLSVFADLLGNTDSVDESRLPRLRHVRLVPLLRKEIELIPHVPPALPRFPSSSPPPPQRSRPPVSLAPPAPPPPDSVKTLILAVGSNRSPPALYSKTPPGAFGAARSSAATTANTRSSTPAGRAGWATKLGVTHSEIARAVADSPAGPYRHVEVVLPARGEKFCDGSCTHNPTILRVGKKFCLYSMGNYGAGVVQPPLNWIHRNHPRIGVAIADSPTGPWTRLAGPLIDVSTDPGAPDALMTRNPAVAVRPDGGVLMLYKAVATQGPPPSAAPWSTSSPPPKNRKAVEDNCGRSRRPFRSALDGAR